MLSPMLVPTPFSELPGWQNDKGISVALDAFCRSARQVQIKPYRTGALGIRFESFAEAYHQAASIVRTPSDNEARAFFENFFQPCRIMADATGPVVTGFYEPEAEASLTPNDTFNYPLYRQPRELVEVLDPHAVAGGWDPTFRFARLTEGGLSRFHDRQAIDQGALARRGLELCWLRDRVDAFFIHVQGAARLTLGDGGKMRVSYAAKSGHPFTGIGRKLAEMGEIPLEQVTMQSIRGWLSNHPDRIDEVLWKNQSYIFFRETELGDPLLGPVAAAKVQLTPGRSIAVDRLLHTFGTPVFIDAPDLAPVFDEPFRRLMIAQDTGSAILGPARGDLFIGTGYQAGEIAGVIRNNAAFYVLVPRNLAELPGQ